MDGVNERFHVFGSRLAESRRSCGFTQEDFAKRLGVTPQALSKWERGTSSPDLSMLSEICDSLGTSADYLLGIGSGRMTENGDDRVQGEILKSLRNGLDSLELIFGNELVPLFINNEFVQSIVRQRQELAGEGILMPIVRIKDHPDLEPKEFMILAYGNILYQENLNEASDEKLDYMVDKLGETVKKKYDEILNADIIKILVDNLKIKYPALIEGVVPEKVSYGLLLDVTKEFVKRGNSPLYLPKIIEGLEREIRENSFSGAAGFAELVSVRLERSDNFRERMVERKRLGKS